MCVTQHRTGGEVAMAQLLAGAARWWLLHAHAATRCSGRPALTEDGVRVRARWRLQTGGHEGVLARCGECGGAGSNGRRLHV
jgi:hypothetical protein